MIKKLSSLFLLIVLFGCAPAVKSTFVDTSNLLLLVDDVAILDLYHQIPPTAVRIGQAKYGDTGFTDNCDCDSNFERAKVLAKKMKCNIVKVVKYKNRLKFSSCCIIEVEFYNYGGDVKKLEQYKKDI
ncbi:hypothetical protein [Flavobacterium facile]|uniref:hypothetical protein n=1 Tax=Flavobacterium facile TaxID=2893174 RepID=UPI002E7611E6|nr:hypothetical protein [Flavobacterium sp. T-12]